MAKFTFSTEIFLVILLFAQSTFCLQCYVCNSVTNVDCNLSSPAEKYRVDCSLDKSASQSTHHLHSEQMEKNSEVVSDSNSNNASDPAALSTQDENTTEFGSHDLDEQPTSSNRTVRSVAENKDDVGQPSFTVLPVKLAKEATFCRKIVNHIPAQTNGPESKLAKQVRIVRSCGFAAEKGGEKEELTCKWIGTDGIQKENCACAGDGCNSGSYLESLKAHTMILFSVMTLGYFYIL